MKYLQVVVLLLLMSSAVYAQGYMKNTGFPISSRTRAATSAAAGSISVFAAAASDVPTIHVQILVDTVGVWGTDSVCVAFNMDTTAAHTIVLHANIVAGQPFEGYSRSLANVKSVQIWSVVAHKIRCIID